MHVWQTRRVIKDGVNRDTMYNVEGKSSQWKWRSTVEEGRVNEISRERRGRTEREMEERKTRTGK